MVLANSNIDQKNAIGKYEITLTPAEHCVHPVVQSYNVLISQSLNIALEISAKQIKFMIMHNQWNKMMTQQRHQDHLQVGELPLLMKWCSFGK